VDFCPPDQQELIRTNSPAVSGHQLTPARQTSMTLVEANSPTVSGLERTPGYQTSRGIIKTNSPAVLVSSGLVVIKSAEL